jgi:hypothetical protein
MDAYTLFQFGGYGFWGITDHFSSYDPSTHVWSFWNNGMAHPGAISLYQYEASGNRFYFAGKMPHDEHRNIKGIISQTACMCIFSGPGPGERRAGYLPRCGRIMPISNPESHSSVPVDSVFSIMMDSGWWT